MTLETTVNDLFMSIMNKYREHVVKSGENLEVNPYQARMISYIAENSDKKLIQKDLAKAFHRRSASITSMLQGLEKKGYIAREIPADNERQKQIRVLPKGMLIVDEINQTIADGEKQLVQALTEEEKDELIRLLSKINQSL